MAAALTLGADLRRFKARAIGNVHAVVRETVETFAESLVAPTQFNGPWTPIGMPETWKSPPPADYRPGNARSSWFLTLGAPSSEKTERTDIQAVNGMGRLTEKPAVQRIFFTNNADHITSLEAAHSHQAPTGILVNAAEFAPMAYSIARRIAA